MSTLRQMYKICGQSPSYATFQSHVWIYGRLLTCTILWLDIRQMTWDGNESMTTVHVWWHISLTASVYDCLPITTCMTLTVRMIALLLRLREKNQDFNSLASVTKLHLENDFIKIINPNQYMKHNELIVTGLRRPPLHWYLTALGFCCSGCMVALLSAYFPSVFLYCLLLPYGRWCWPWRMFPQRVPCTGAPVSEQLQHLGTKTFHHSG